MQVVGSLGELVTLGWWVGGKKRHTVTDNMVFYGLAYSTQVHEGVIFLLTKWTLCPFIFYLFFVFYLYSYHLYGQLSPTHQRHQPNGSIPSVRCSSSGDPIMRIEFLPIGVVLPRIDFDQKRTTPINMTIIVSCDINTQCRCFINFSAKAVVSTPSG